MYGASIVKHYDVCVFLFLGRASAQSADANAEPNRPGARTGQGRQPRSGRAHARALTRSTLGLPRQWRVQTARRAIRAEPSHGARIHRATTLYSVGSPRTRDHDAAMRICGDAPGQRDHSVERRKPGTSAVHRHLGSLSDIHLIAGERRYCLDLLLCVSIIAPYAEQYRPGFHRSS